MIKKPWPHMFRVSSFPGHWTEERVAVLWGIWVQCFRGLNKFVKGPLKGRGRDAAGHGFSAFYYHRSQNSSQEAEIRSSWRWGYDCDIAIYFRSDHGSQAVWSAQIILELPGRNTYP
jgi:hypothetical protein